MSTRSRCRAKRRRKSSVPATEPAPSSTPVRTLRLRIGLLRSRRGLALRRSSLLGRDRRFELAQTALQVVEDESDRRLRRGRRGDQAVTVPDHEDAPALQGDLELRELTAAVRRLALPLGFRQQPLGFLCDALCTLLVRERRADDLAPALEDNGGADL